MALILRNGGSQSPDRWLREPRNNHTFFIVSNSPCFLIVVAKIGKPFVNCAFGFVNIVARIGKVVIGQYGGIRAKLSYGRNAARSGRTAVMGKKRNNCLAGQVIFFKERPNRHWQVVPPNGELKCSQFL